MAADGPTDIDARATVRQALRGWQQRVQAVIEIARDSDDLAARLPVLDHLAHELVADLARAIDGLDAAVNTPGATLPPGVDVLREALGHAHARIGDIDLWHRAPAVAALRQARDLFGLAAARTVAEPRPRQ